MGGRGASSGMSHYERKDGTVVENPYGSQYHAVMTAGNVKFVSKNSRQSEPLMETMTGGRSLCSRRGKRHQVDYLFRQREQTIETN